MKMNLFRYIYLLVFILLSDFTYLVSMSEPVRRPIPRQPVPSTLPHTIRPLPTFKEMLPRLQSAYLQSEAQTRSLNDTGLLVGVLGVTALIKSCESIYDAVTYKSKQARLEKLFAEAYAKMQAEEEVLLAREKEEELARERVMALAREKAEAQVRERFQALLCEQAEVQAAYEKEETLVRAQIEIQAAREQVEAQVREENEVEACVLNYWEKIGKFKSDIEQRRVIPDDLLNKPVCTMCQRYIEIERTKLLIHLPPDPKRMCTPGRLLRELKRSEPLIYVPYVFSKLEPTCRCRMDLKRNEPLIYVLSNRKQADLVSAMVPVVVIASAGGTIVTAPVIPIVVGGGLAIAWVIKVGIPLLKGIKVKWAKEELKKESGGGGGGGGGKDPNDKDKKNKKIDKIFPNGKAVKNPNNPKHHPNSKGNIGKSIPDEQRALDESIEVPKKDYRAGIHDGKYVKFMKEGEGTYHGFFVENFHDLDPAAQNALYNAGLVRDTTKGKIR